MHPWDLATGPRKRPLGEDSSPGSPNETWVLVVEVSLAEAGRTHLWSMTCCVRREVRSQAVRERRSRLDLVTEQFDGPTMRATSQAAMNGCERLDSRGRIRIRVSTRSQDIVRDTAEGVLRWWFVAPYRAENARFWLLR